MNSFSILIYLIHLQIRIKQENLSDSEENSKLSVLSGLEKIKRERDESSDESESDSDESESNDRPEESGSSDSEVNVKQENSTISKENGNGPPLKQIKKEKEHNDTDAAATYIPRPIKREPQSDTEGTSKFKKPASNTIQSTKLLSTVKIKQEPPSEDESGKRKKRKTTENSKSFESIENDLFDSFLK